MKHSITDALQVIAAVIITTSLVVVNAAPLKQTPTAKAVAVVKTTPAPTKPAPAAVVAPVVATTPVSAPAPVVAAPVASPPVYSGSHEDWMAAAGIAPSDYAAVDGIISNESGWCPTVWEGERGCPAYHGVSDTDGYGLCQSTPPQKMSVEGAGWETDPVLQLKWCAIHAAGYGGWWAAWDHWQINRNW